MNKQVVGVLAGTVCTLLGILMCEGKMARKEGIRADVLRMAGYTLVAFGGGIFTASA